MSAISFDTLAYAKKLKEQGFTDQQAEGQAEALSVVLKEGAGELATRGDLLELQRSAKEDLLEFKTEVNSRFERIEGRMNLIQWMLGFNLAVTVAILWLILRSTTVT